MEYELRPAVAEDIDWLCAFYERIMRPYVELTHKWDGTIFRERYVPSQSKIIRIEGRDVGLFKKEAKDGHLFLWDIQLEEEFRNRGIGTELIESVQREAEAMGVPVRLRVLKGNPAKGLYERMGFGTIEEMEFCFLMEWGGVPSEK